jgi:maltose alpha-D-glucosyltransferase/alpha-amylase
LNVWGVELDARAPAYMRRWMHTEREFDYHTRDGGGGEGSELKVDRGTKGVRLADDPLWYKDALIYQLHVKAFFDSNNDGVGDFRGLTERLDYLQDLGVNTLWLLPFYPSPMRDDGYDIADYRNIYSEYGSRKDFRAFVREAHARGIRVITELIINHTSDQHPWFQAARRAPPGSAKRSFYVWSDTDQKFSQTRIIFTDTESSNWAWDPVAQQYYWHRFFSHQPDLNHNNPQVVQAVIRLMRFWLDMGVDGLRLDAIPYLCVQEGTNNENLPETHAVIRRMRAVIDAHYRGRMFLAEANQWPEDVRDYFGDGDECHMAYHFPLMPRMYMAVAQEDRHPIIEIMRQTPEIPDSCQWAIFLRNHDELTLEMVTDRERDYMYQSYAADPRMRVNVGIRRRLAPLMENDVDRIKLLNSLLLSMPGSPIIYYGDELGMGENIYLGDRNGVRTPMQWSPDRNAGFSKADPQRLYLPPIMDPIYGYGAVNVEAQSRDPSSLLHWMKRIIAVRQAHRAFGRGSITFLHPGNRKILGYLREHDGDVVLCAANLARHAQPVELDLSRFRGCVPVEMMGGTAFPPIGELPYLLTLPGHGFYWFRLAREAQVPSWHEERLPPLELPILVLPQGWISLFPERVPQTRKTMAKQLQHQLEREILPQFLGTRRWFAGKGQQIRTIDLVDLEQWEASQGNWLLSRLEVALEDGGEGEGAATQQYFLPLAISWGDLEDEGVRGLLPAALARARRHAKLGILYDAFAAEAFCRDLVLAIGRGQDIPFGGGVLEFRPTSAYAMLAGEEPSSLSVRRPAVEGSNSAAILGETLFLKGYRRLHPGESPELEMGRFLTEVSPYDNVVPVAGSIQYRGPDGTPCSLALLQGYVENQGDAWSYCAGYLDRFLRDCLARPLEIERQEYHGAHLVMMRTLGQRTAELHRALAVSTGNAVFDPESIAFDEPLAWAGKVAAEANETLTMLARQREDLPARVQDMGDRLLAMREAVPGQILALAPTGVQAVKTRLHGDYHLGQVLLKEVDFVIVDFEGEPVRPLAERRAKHSALKDVAGMLRSFNYASWSALHRLTIERPEDLSVLEPFARVWEEQTRQAFLQGYEETIAACAVWPDSKDHTRGLLDLFTLEKAFYEVRYELSNRPDWVAIPLGAVLRLLAEQTSLADPDS